MDGQTTVKSDLTPFGHNIIIIKKKIINLIAILVTLQANVQITKSFVMNSVLVVKALIYFYSLVYIVHQFFLQSYDRF